MRNLERQESMLISVFKSINLLVIQNQNSKIQVWFKMKDNRGLVEQIVINMGKTIYIMIE